MYCKRPRTSGSFGPDGRRLDGGTGPSNALVTTTTATTASSGYKMPAASLRRTSSGTAVKRNNIINPGALIQSRRPLTTMGPPKGAIQRAPIMSGLNLASSGVLKPFIRPKLGRRAYKGQENEALRRSSLGPRRSFGGLERIMSRAGKGLNFVSARNKAQNGSGTDDESESEEEKEAERPFEPLMVWQSPHQGGEAKGLPKTM